MTSTDTAAESLEELTKKSQDSEDPPESESAEKHTYIRFLVSKKLAGSLIGKGGSTITEFQANSGARILLSRRSEYFPGTTHRVVVVSGTIKEVVTALELVLGKLHSEFQAEYASDIELKRIRIVVPHSSCGGIIGKRGATIKSKAGVRISKLDNTFLGLSDRLVTLSGTMEEQMRLIALVLTKLTEDDEYSQQVHSPNSYAGLYNLGFHGSNSVNYTRSLFGTNQIHQEDNITSVTVGVPDEHIGAVIGPGGENIKCINLITGARIKVSGRGDFVPGTTDSYIKTLPLLVTSGFFFLSNLAFFFISGKLLSPDSKLRSNLLYR